MHQSLKKIAMAANKLQADDSGVCGLGCMHVA